MKVHFILVEPAVPENIGAAARALKTMQFSSLRLVNPCDHLHVKARMLAHGAQDVLENAKIFYSLEAALEDVLTPPALTPQVAVPATAAITSGLGGGAGTRTAPVVQGDLVLNVRGVLDLRNPDTAAREFMLRVRDYLRDLDRELA